MKPLFGCLTVKRFFALTAALVLSGAGWAIAAQPVPRPLHATEELPTPPAPPAPPAPGAPPELVIEAINAESADEQPPRKDMPWLGLATGEATEALAAQLDLEPGVGLVVNYLAPDGPAAKAGLQKNDLLVQLGDQLLVHPAQLRKLLFSKKPGDTVNLTFYHAGKKQTADVKLGKAPPGLRVPEVPRAFVGKMADLDKQLQQLHLEEAIRNKVHGLHDSLGNLVDQKKVQIEIRRSMEEARRAIQGALSNLNASGERREKLADIPDVVVRENATVTVRNDGNQVKSLVKTDDSGTIVLVRNGKLHLTAHDKDGKLLFDGVIETEEDRDKVPADLRERVKPLLEQLNSEKSESSEKTEKPEEE